MWTNNSGKNLNHFEINWLQNIVQVFFALIGNRETFLPNVFGDQYENVVKIQFLGRVNIMIIADMSNRISKVF